MKRTDKNMIQFFTKSPVQSFAAMLDALRYLDGNRILEDIEYELFNDSLGDNAEGKVKIRVPALPGIAANALIQFAWHAKAWNLIRRRSRKLRAVSARGDEIIVFYKVTPAGHEMIKILEAIDMVQNPDRNSRTKPTRRGNKTAK